MIRPLILIAVAFLISCNNYQEHDYRIQSENQTLKEQLDSLRLENAHLVDEIIRYKSKLKIKPKQQKKIISKRDTSIHLASNIVKDPILEEDTKIKNETFKSEYVAPKAETYSSQCMATTKKGRRCSRSSRSGDYCWQHGG